MDLQCIVCITNSSYAVKTPKDEVTCDTYWNFYKKLKIWTCLPQNGRFRDQTGGWEITSQNRRIPLKMGGLEHMLLLTVEKVFKIFISTKTIHLGQKTKD